MLFFGEIFLTLKSLFLPFFKKQETGVAHWTLPRLVPSAKHTLTTWPRVVLACR